MSKSDARSETQKLHPKLTSISEEIQCLKYAGLSLNWPIGQFSLQALVFANQATVKVGELAGEGL